MMWTDDPTRAKRLGRNVMLVGYVVGPVPAGLTLGAALTTGVSAAVSRLAAVALVIGMIVALCGGVLLNIAARAGARAAGRPPGSLGPVDARRVRAFGNAALTFGAVSLAVGAISTSLKLIGARVEGSTWLYFVLLMATSVPLLIAGIAFRKIATSKLVEKN